MIVILVWRKSIHF